MKDEEKMTSKQTLREGGKIWGASLQDHASIALSPQTPSTSQRGNERIFSSIVHHHPPHLLCLGEQQGTPNPDSSMAEKNTLVQQSKQVLHSEHLMQYGTTDDLQEWDCRGLQDHSLDLTQHSRFRGRMTNELGRC